jgi:hypothetical protein
VDRLESIFGMLNEPAHGEKCEAIWTLIVDGEERMRETRV